MKGSQGQQSGTIPALIMVCVFLTGLVSPLQPATLPEPPLLHGQAQENLGQLGNVTTLIQNATSAAFDPGSLSFSYSMAMAGSTCFTDDFNDNSLDTSKWTVVNAANGINEVQDRLEMNVIEQQKKRAILRTTDIDFGNGVDVNVDGIRHIAGNGFVGRPVVRVVDADDPTNWVYILMDMWTRSTFMRDSAGTKTIITNQAPTGWHHYELLVSAGQYTGFLDTSSATVPSTIFAATETIYVELEYRTGGSSNGFKDRGAWDNIDVCPEEVIFPVTDGFTRRDYKPESPAGTTPFDGALIKPTLPTTGGAGSSVSLATGEFVADFPLLHVPQGIGNDFTFTLTYRSIGNHDGHPGVSWGWDANWLQRLQTNGTGYDHHTGDGRILHFSSTASGYDGPPGTYTRLESVGGKLYMTDRDGNIRVFDPANSLRLTDVYDPAGNHWTITHASTSSTITDPTGRDIDLQYATAAGNPFYDANGAPLLQKITDFEGREASLVYDTSSGRLTGIKTQGPTATSALTTTFGYNSAGHLASVTDPESNTYIQSSYDTAGRVITQSQGGGLAYTFEYDFFQGQTIVTDGNNNVVHWNFLPFGTTEPRVVPATKIEFTRGLRTTDPASYQTSWTHNSQDEITSITNPAGNGVSFEYDETSSSFFARGNLLRTVQDPGANPPLRDDGRLQTSIVTEYTYDPVYNRVTSVTEARETDTTWNPQNGGTSAAGRFTTQYIYDFQEAALGDQNGDPVNRNDQRVVKIIYPEINAAGAPHAAFLQPGASTYAYQTRSETFVWNDDGQLVSRTDPSGTTETRTYYTTSTAGKPEGYLETATSDAGTGNLNLAIKFEYTDFGAPLKFTDPSGEVTSATVDLRGRITQIVDPAIGTAAGYRTKVSYDDNDNVELLERETDSGTNLFTEKEFIYDSLGRIDKEKTYATRPSTITSVVSPQCTTPCSLSATTITVDYDYDANHNLIKRTGGSGEVSTWDYDERDLLLTASGPSGGTYAYDLNGNLARYTDQRGYSTIYQYDGFDRPTSTTDARGTSFTQNYDPAGNVVRQRGLSSVGGILYDKVHNYDEAGQLYRLDEWLSVPVPSSLPDTSGTLSPGDSWVTTMRQYDVMGRLSRTFNDNYNPITYQYDAVGRLLQAEDAVGNSVASEWDDNGNLEKTTESHVVSGGGCPCITIYDYDEMNRLISLTQPDGTTQSYSYDGRNNIVASVDQTGRKTETLFDYADRPWVETRRAPGGSVVTEISTHWDEEGRVERKCDGNDVCTAYTYVSETQLVASEGPAGTNGRPIPSVTYVRDANGNPELRQWSSGKTVATTFDELNRPTTVTPTVAGAAPSWGTRQQVFVYDALGRVTRATDDGVNYLAAPGTTDVKSAHTVVVANQDFDTLGRVVSERQLGVDDTIHIIDGVGNVQSTQYPSGDRRLVSRTYDDTERVQRITDPKGVLADYTYAGPRIVRDDVSPTIRWEAQYDSMKRPTNQVYYGVAGDVTNIQTHYASGQRVAHGLESTYTPLSSNQFSQAWAHDDLFRLTSWDRGVLDPVSKTVLSPVDQATFAPDDSNELPSFTRGATTCSRAVTGTNDVEERCPSSFALPTRTFTRDADGNLVNDGTYLYRWDFKNRLVRVDDQTGNLVVAYAYDALDRRVIKIFPNNSPGGNPNIQSEDEAWFSYAGPHLIQESLPIQRSANPERGNKVFVIRQWVYTDLDTPIVMDWAKVSNSARTTAIGGGDVRYYYQRDANNNIVGLLEENGRLVEGYQYDSYGGVTVLVPDRKKDVTWDASRDEYAVHTGGAGTCASTGTAVPGMACSPSGNIWFFTGRQYDWEIGSFHYRARQYHPDLNQFMNIDPLGAWGDALSLGNPYAYVGNNPGSMVDPWGLFTWRDCHGSVRWACQGLDVIGTATVDTVGQGTAEGLWYLRDDVFGSSAEGAQDTFCSGGSGLVSSLAPGVATGCAFAGDYEDGTFFNEGEYALDYGTAPLDFIPGGGLVANGATSFGIFALRNSDKALDVARHGDEGVEWIEQLGGNFARNGDEMRDATSWVAHERIYPQRVIGRSDDLEAFAGKQGYNTFIDRGTPGWRESTNHAWIDKGIERGESFRVATKDPLHPDNIWNDPHGKRAGTRTPFGHEIMWLQDKGYVYSKGYMVPGRGL